MGAGWAILFHFCFKTVSRRRTSRHREPPLDYPRTLFADRRLGARPLTCPSALLGPPAIQVFDFETHAVRVVLDELGYPWWLAADVCRVLQLAGDPGQHTRRRDADEKGLISVQTPGAQSFNCISESGLYALIFKSRKPLAKLFRLTSLASETLRRE